MIKESSRNVSASNGNKETYLSELYTDFELVLPLETISYSATVDDFIKKTNSKMFESVNNKDTLEKAANVDDVIGETDTVMDARGQILKCIENVKPENGESWEQAAQGALRDVLKGIGFMDTHDKCTLQPVFEPIISDKQDITAETAGSSKHINSSTSLTSTVSKVYCKQSSKPDFTSRNNYVFLELKGSNVKVKNAADLLVCQLVRRVVGTLTVFGHAKQAIGIGITDDSEKNYICIGKRIPVDGKHEIQFLKPCKISRVDAIAYLVQFSSLSDDEFITEDGKALLTALTKLNEACGSHYYNHFVGTKLIGSSIHNVYGIYECKWEDRYPQIDMFNPKCCIKLFDCEANKVVEDFQMEKKIYEALKREYNDDFFIGSFYINRERVHISVDGTLGSFVDAKTCENRDSENSWCANFYNDVCKCGIVMKVGEVVSANTISSEIFVNICSFLVKLHSVGYVHSDVRIPNIAKYKNSYRLIDFGYAGKLRKGGRAQVGAFEGGREKILNTVLNKFSIKAESDNYLPIIDFLMLYCLQ